MSSKYTVQFFANYIRKVISKEMSGLGLSALRVGKKYWLLNLGEKFEFQITDTIGNHDFRVKDLNTLETYTISELVRYGRGKDFEIRELRQ